MGPSGFFTRAGRESAILAPLFFPPHRPAMSPLPADLPVPVEPMVFVDLETTGANPVRDRITEIGIVSVSAAGVEEWSSLVNPGQPIPPFIQELTHINDGMVAGAPAFADLAPEVLERLKGRLFVAHNARFDYGFLKNEFQRLGIRFHATVLCTVKLSRKLTPEHFRHSLDALIERWGLYDPSRHRALSDARLIWQFWQKLHGPFSPEAVQGAVDQLTQRPVLPPQLDGESLDDLPELPGAYVFYGDPAEGPGEVPLYVGRGTNLRQRVFFHFAPGGKGDPELNRRVRRVEWRESAGELGAQLLESRLKRELRPELNTLPKRAPELCAWRLVERQRGDWRPELVMAADLDFAGRDDLFGLFNTPKEARNSLKKIADAHQLCHVLLGLEKARPGKGCFAFQQQGCYGACVGKEPLGHHSARLMAALAKLKVRDWPYGGPIALKEKDDFNSTEDWHVVDRWCYLGTARNAAGVWALLEGPRPAFDQDSYRLLSKALAQGKVEVEELQAPPRS